MNVTWKSKGLADENSTTPTTKDNILSPSIKWYENLNFYLIFKGNCLKQKSATFTAPNVINVFTVYELDTWSPDLNSDFTLKDCIYGGFKLARNADPDKCKYTDYGIGFDSRSEFSMALRCRSFSKKKIKKKHLYHHDENYCYFCKSNIPVINSIVGSRNMIKLSKNMSL